MGSSKRIHQVQSKTSVIALARQGRLFALSNIAACTSTIIFGDRHHQTALHFKVDGVWWRISTAPALCNEQYSRAPPFRIPNVLKIVLLL